jgi:hypothetical protein
MKIKLLCLLSILVLAVGCGYGNHEDVKKHAKTTWESNGFELVGYQGYHIGFVVPFTSYGGACVWYRIKRIPYNDITYEGAIQKWVMSIIYIQ